MCVCVSVCVCVCVCERVETLADRIHKSGGPLVVHHSVTQFDSQLSN